MTTHELLVAGALCLVRIDTLKAAPDGQAVWQGCVYVTPEETAAGRQVHCPAMSTTACRNLGSAVRHTREQAQRGHAPACLPTEQHS